MTSKLALNLIVKDEEKNIASALSSVIPNVEAIYILDTGSTDRTVEIARSLGANVIEVGEKFVHVTTEEEEKWVKDYLGPNTFLKKGDKLFQFAEARNYLLEKTPKDYKWILWIDGDDIFDGKENLKTIIQDAESKNADQVFLNYLYHCEFNPDGTIKNVVIEHLRERLFKNDGTYQWVAGIHETLINQRQDAKIDSKLAQVIHTTQLEDMTQSIQRNIRNLEYEIYKTKAEDPRPIYYLAKAYYDLGQEGHLRDADRLIQAYLQGSGWAEERAQAWQYRSWIRTRLGDHKGAIKALMNSFIEEPFSPEQFISLSQAYMFAGEWEKALFWLKLSAQIPEKKTTLINNPRDMILKSLEVAYNASINTNKLDEAWAAMYKLIEMYPDNPVYKEQWTFVNNLKEQKELTNKALDISRHLIMSGQKEKVKYLVMGLPEEVASNQLITALSQQVTPPRIHGKNEISIFCGPGFEIWSPKTIEERGSGGSEEAVYRLSQEFNKLGYKVTVYAMPGDDRGEHNGVTYLNHYEANFSDQFNYFISWRRPDALTWNLKTKKHFLWLHDIPNKRDFTPERLKNVDKVVVMSQYQASLLEPIEQDGQTFGVPKEQILVSRNGVTL